MDLVRHFEQQQTQASDLPHIRPGDVIRVEMKVQEGDKTRLQTFEGTVLALRGSGPSATMTVRRETGNFGVERIFPLYSPLIASIEIVKRQKVRRAKLSYLRQTGRRRFKEDVKAMQSHLKEEADKKRLAELAEKKQQEEEAQKAKEAEAKKKAEEAAQKKEEKAEAAAEEVATPETEVTPEADTSSEEKEQVEEKTDETATEETEAEKK